jgi:3-mercaptopyruvate sulfurtransferase SseA
MRSRWGWLAIALALTGCVDTSSPTAVTASAPPAAVVTPQPENTPATWVPPRIAVDEAYQRIQKGEDIVIVDVRSEAAYGQEHITNAVSVPWTNLKEKYGLLPKDKLLLLYCT